MTDDGCDEAATELVRQPIPSRIAAASSGRSVTTKRYKPVSPVGRSIQRTPAPACLSVANMRPTPPWRCGVATMSAKPTSWLASWSAAAGSPGPRPREYRHPPTGVDVAPCMDLILAWPAEKRVGDVCEFAVSCMTAPFSKQRLWRSHYPRWVCRPRPSRRYFVESPLGTTERRSPLDHPVQRRPDHSVTLAGDRLEPIPFDDRNLAGSIPDET
jgi:hypothetical protein